MHLICAIIDPQPTLMEPPLLLGLLALVLGLASYASGVRMGLIGRLRDSPHKEFIRFYLLGLVVADICLIITGVLLLIAFWPSIPSQGAYGIARWTFCSAVAVFALLHLVAWFVTIRLIITRR
jgi:hypothetical protein